MAECQNIEWKESWRDEYLKWICGFANAQGGKIYIGKDDDGKVVGVADSKRLMEELPNKIRDVLGILPEVNLHTEGGKDYIEIVVAPSGYPVNCKGEYHYRSGSTKLLLTGAALTEFLLTKTGLKWDAVPVDGVTMDDLDKESFDIFRREALRSRRMTEDDLNITNAQLLDNLGLVTGGKLKRAAVMLFHRNQEKWFSGAYIKLGYFENDADLRYQDEIHGSLFIQADRVIDLIYLKYLKAEITYEGVTRVEKYPVPKDAVREAVYNALIHCDYSACVPIQISIYADKMYIGNSCVFPAGWTVDTLMQKHNSRPHNPDIANGFFRAGLVEIWGRGIEKIYTSCKENGAAAPEYTVHSEDILVRLEAQKSAKGSPKVQNELLDEPLKIQIIELMQNNPKVTQTEMANELKISTRRVKSIISALTEDGTIERRNGKRYGMWIVKKF